MATLLLWMVKSPYNNIVDSLDDSILGVSMEPIRISYFSDVLCVWADLAQIWLDELISNFPGQVVIEHHYPPKDQSWCQ